MTEKTHEHSLFRSAGLIGLATLGSRLAGMVRDVVSAGLFGTSRVWDAFLLAFIVPNFLRRLVGEGALANAFIPVYSEVLHREGRAEADRIANIVFSLLSVVLGALVVLAVIGVQVALAVLELPAKLELTLQFLTILFPYVLCLSYVALLMGILHCHKHFLAPALSPVILNIIWIIAVLVLCPLMGNDRVSQARVLAFCILGAGVLQLAIQFWPLRKLRFRLKFILKLGEPAIKKIGGLLGPSILTFAAMQIGFLMDMILAFWVGDGANSTLWYGNRLMQFPLGIFGIAMGTALLPTISQQAAEGSAAQMVKTLSFALRCVFYVVVPATVGLIVLKTPIVRLLFERGAFDAQSTARTAQTLMFYSIGLFAFSGQKILAATFYGMQDTKTPFKIAAVNVFVNLALSLILMRPLGEGGLALATSLSGVLNFCILVLILRRKLDSFILMPIVIYFAKALLVSCLMGLLVAWTYQHLPLAFIAHETLASLGRLSAAILIGVVFYGIASVLLRFSVLKEALR